MASIQKVQAVWTGFGGGPGTTTMYATVAADLLTPLRAFFNSLIAILPTGLTITLPGIGDIINDADGELTGTWGPVTSPAPVVGTGVAVYSAPSGVSVQWHTTGIVGGRRVKGRTYLVPWLGLQADGSPSPTSLATLSTALGTYLAASAGNMKIWQRPRAASDGPPPVAARAGSSWPVDGSQVGDFMSVLRSRRD